MTEPRPSFEGWLRRSLVGEYVAMLTMSYSVMTAAMWGAYLVAALLALVLMLDSAWIFLRCIGFLSGHAVTPMLSLGLFAATAGIVYADFDILPAWLTTGPFSPQVMLSPLGGIMLIDLGEARESQIRNRAIGSEAEVTSFLETPTRNHKAMSQQAMPIDQQAAADGDLLAKFFPARNS